MTTCRLAHGHHNGFYSAEPHCPRPLPRAMNEYLECEDGQPFPAQDCASALQCSLNTVPRVIIGYFR